MKTRIIVAAILGLLVGLSVGRGCGSHPNRGDRPTADPVPAVSQAEIWTCSMHPQIRQPKPGQCPICFMDLIPAATHGSGTAAGPREIELSAAARQLAGIETAPVERRAVAVDIRLAGKVRLDETRVAVIAPRVPGRIDRLYANFTGMAVKPGEPLADLYSPELVSAQQELLQAAKLPGGAADSMLAATRERLRRWGLTAEQVAGIERDGQVHDHVTFTAPIGGVVVEKDAREGQYVETGMRLFAVADLSQVWVLLEAYESDLAYLRPGQAVEFEAEAYPGEAFKGTLAFLDPVVDPATRTVRVRVEVANADGRLKPEMFVRALVRASVAEAGEALPLVVPATAPLVTGPRAVVYVAAPDRAGVFAGREVVLGPRAGDYYVVRAGLQEGEPVVVHGAFKIDSSLQIQGKPSMMAGTPPADGGAGSGAEEARRLQILCPIMNRPIDRKLYHDYEGQRIYVCCPGCLDEVRARAGEIVAEQTGRGIEFEKVPREAAHAH